VPVDEPFFDIGFMIHLWDYSRQTKNMCQIRPLSDSGLGVAPD
jgi:hypothetical protein